MNDKVVPINAAVATGDREASEMSQQCVTALERMLEMARKGEMTGLIGIIQLADTTVGTVSAGGGGCHPYTTLGALEALTEHHKLAIMNHVQMRPVFQDTPDAPTKS